MGLNYQGSGVYSLSKQSSEYDRFGGKKFEKYFLELKNEVVKEIIAFTATNNYNYKITLVEKLGLFRPFIVVTFKVFNKDGSLVLSKDDAKKQLLELKEYLDLGIITQDDFDKKATYLKKILLGN